MEVKREVFSGLKFPTTTHQSVVGWLFTEIAVHLRRHEADRRVIAAPFAVFLGEEGDSYLKPDITVMGDDGKLDDEGFHGVPDWVAEVVSPDSRAFDYGRKLAAYIDAGVREYWIVDPEKQIVVAYYLENPDTPVIHHFGDVVRSAVLEELEVDTSPLMDIWYEEKSIGGETGGSGGSPERSSELHDQNEVKMMSVDEVKEYMEENFEELVSARNKGQLMKAAIGALKGKAESRTFNEAVAELCRV